MPLVFYRTNSVRSIRRATQLLPEAKTFDLGRHWGVRTDPPHHAKMQRHTHITHYGDDVWIVNDDGTDSHGTTRDSVPNWVMDELRNKRIIEHVRRCLRADFGKGRKARFQSRPEILIESQSPPRKRFLTFKEFLNQQKLGRRKT